MAFRCFNNGKPKLVASDKTYNKKVQTIYQHNKTQFGLGESGNYEKTICYDTANSRIKKTQNFETLLALNYGLALCDDCSGSTVQNPLPDTEYGPKTTLTVASYNLVDISCNAIIDSSCNLDFTYEASGVLAGWVQPAPGDTTIIDPDNLIIGDMTDCEQKKYLDLVTMSSIDVSGNDTRDNYLRYFQHPRQIKLT